MAARRERLLYHTPRLVCTGCCSAERAAVHPHARIARASLAAVLACALLSACGSPAPASSSTQPTSPSRPTTPGSTRTATPAAGAEPSTPATPVHPARAVSGTAPAAALPFPAPIATIPAPKPAKTLTGPRDLAVPMLMYHVIGVAPTGAAHPDLYVTPAEFVAQLRYLSAHGYHVVTLQRAYDFWQGEATLPSKPVIMSFDDGDTPDFTIAAPLMNEVRWPGVLNLIVGKRKLRLKPGIIRALIAAGWEIDSHTMTHTDVPGLGAKQLVYEIAGSRKALQRLYGVPVNFFCYPSGRFDDAAIAEVKAAGYLGATTTRGGLAKPSELYLLRRVRVSAGTSPAGLGALLGDAR
jgi:peptidoglycan/xylan/chitin deacetylase (PgdA/CDA1 family)